MKIEGMNIEKMKFSNIRGMLSRDEMKQIRGGSGPGCMSRGTICDPITEDTNCCGSGRCLAFGGPTGYICE